MQYPEGQSGVEIRDTPTPETTIRVFQPVNGRTHNCSKKLAAHDSPHDTWLFQSGSRGWSSVGKFKSKTDDPGIFVLVRSRRILHILYVGLKNQVRVDHGAVGQFPVGFAGLVS